MSVTGSADQPIWLRIVKSPPVRIVVLGFIIFYMMAFNNGFTTCGSFGVESSVLALVACTVTGIILIYISWKRGHILPPPWTRR